jgi:hypothetical protein
MQIVNARLEQRDGDSGSHPSQQLGKSERQGSKQMLFQLPAPDGADPMQKEPVVLTELVPEDGGVEHPDVESVAESFAVHKEELAGHIALLAAVPEASLPSR